MTPTPNPAMHRTLREKPRKAGDFERWAKLAVALFLMLAIGASAS